MNAMVQEMSWKNIRALEAAKHSNMALREAPMLELSNDEIESVSGAGWFTAAVGAAGGWAGSHGHARHRRVIIAAAAAILSY